MDSKVIDITGTLLELVKYTLPALVVLIASYLIVKKFLVTGVQRKQLTRQAHPSVTCGCVA